MRKNKPEERRILSVRNIPARIGLTVLSLIGLGFFLAPLKIGILNLGNGFGILCCGLLAAFFGCNGIVSKFLGRIGSSRIGRWILRILLLFILLGVVLVVFLSILMIRASSAPSNAPQTVIVLGCKVNGSTPSLMLVRRLDVAYDYLVENESAIVIVTGGRGADEDISEAEAMMIYLMQKGISKERIFVEDQSTSTFENLRNAQDIMHANGMGDSAVIATDGFHQLRAQMIAGELGLRTQALSAETPGWLLPTYWVREWFGVVHEYFFPAERGAGSLETGISSDPSGASEVTTGSLTEIPTAPATESTDAQTEATVTEATVMKTTVMETTESQEQTAEDIASLDAGTIVDVTGLSEGTIQACFYSEEISDSVFARMDGKSFKEDGEMLRSDLRYVRILHVGPDGAVHVGELVVNQKIAEDIVDIFKELYAAGYVIGKMVLIDEYILVDNSSMEENNAADDASMADNNTSAFNYRIVSGSTKLSNHAMGLAIDVNPFYNPWVHTLDGVTLTEPETGAQYADRTLDCEYYIDHEDLCYQLFIEHGFIWGGDWSSSKDYQHFQKA